MPTPEEQPTTRQATPEEIEAFFHSLTIPSKRAGALDIPLLETLENHYGGNIVSPEKVLEAFQVAGVVSFDNGVYPALPKNIEAILSEQCPHSDDPSKRVGDTHVLSYLPGTIEFQDGRNTPCTIDELIEIIPQVAVAKGYSDAGKVMWSHNDYGNETIKTSRPSSLANEGKWTLIPLIPVKGTLNVDDQKSRAIVANTPNYEEVEGLEVLSAILQRYALTGERTPNDWWGRTNTRVLDAQGNDQGSCLLVGHFNSDGLRADGSRDGGVSSLRGRFARRILDS